MFMKIVKLSKVRVLTFQLRCHSYIDWLNHACYHILSMFTYSVTSQAWLFFTRSTYVLCINSQAHQWPPIISKLDTVTSECIYKQMQQ